MMITKDNLYYITYENENARLLIADIVMNKNTSIYNCRDTEITIAMALDIWYRVNDEKKRKTLSRTLPKPHRRYKLLFMNSCERAR